MDGDGEPADGFAQYAPVVVAIVVIQEDDGAVDATLGHVQRNAGDFRTRLAGHDGRDREVTATTLPSPSPVRSRMVLLPPVGKLLIPSVSLFDLPGIDRLSRNFACLDTRGKS